MFNLLIAEDNVHYAKNLINYLINMNKEIRLVNFSTDGKETIENIYCNSIDLIILDLKMPKMSGLDVLQEIKKLDLEPMPDIIVISGESELIKEVRNYEEVSAFINKSVGLEEINKIIVQLIRQKKLNTRNKEICNVIKQELISLGFNIKHKGTTYIAESIELAYEINNKQYCENLEKYLYSRVAKIHSKSIQNIKTNIVKATNCMYLDGNREFIMKYFRFSYDYKPTPKMIINTILSKL